MGFWNFLGGFAVFNALWDLFSSKSKQTDVTPQQCYNDKGHDQYLSHDINSTDLEDLQERVDEMQSRLDETDVTSERYDDLQERIDELQDRIDTLEEWEDIQDELDDLQDELDDLEYDRDLYDDRDDW